MEARRKQVIPCACGNRHAQIIIMEIEKTAPLSRDCRTELLRRILAVVKRPGPVHVCAALIAPRLLQERLIRVDRAHSTLEGASRST